MDNQKFADYDALINIIVQKYRQKREELFKKLDGDYFKALEKNDVASLNFVQRRKELLRNFPEKIKEVDFNNRQEILSYIPEGFENEM